MADGPIDSVILAYGKLTSNRSNPWSEGYTQTMGVEWLLEKGTYYWTDGW